MAQRRPYDPKNNRKKRVVKNQPSPRNYRPQSRYYSHDSSARQVHEEIEYEQSPRPVVKRRVVRTNKKAEIVYDKQSKFSKHFLTHVILATFFAAVLGLFALQLNLQYTQNQLGVDEERLAALQEINRLRTQEMYAAINLDMIREIAVTELGMVEPSTFQIERLHAPRVSFSLNIDEPTITQSSFSLATIRNIFSRNND